MQFTFETSPARVVFGRGGLRAALPAEVERLGAQRLIVVADPSHEMLAREAHRPVRRGDGRLVHRRRAARARRPSPSAPSRSPGSAGPTPC